MGLKYNIYLDGKFIKESTSLSAIVDGLEAETEYSVTVSETDGKTESKQTSEVKFTTLPNLNLLKGTTQSFAHDVTNSDWEITQIAEVDSLPLEIKTITLSYDWEVSNTSTEATSMFSAGYGLGSKVINVNENNQAGHNSETFIVANTINDTGKVFLSCKEMPAGTHIVISNLKAEYGSRETSWRGAASEEKYKE